MKGQTRGDTSPLVCRLTGFRINDSAHGHSLQARRCFGQRHRSDNRRDAAAEGIFGVEVECLSVQVETLFVWRVYGPAAP